MQAIRRKYDNGKVKLDKTPPLNKSNIIVIFPENEITKDEDMSTEEALRILRKYSGSITRDIDYDKAKDEYMNEKYGPFN